MLDEQFQRRPLPAEPFGHSMGVFSGEPEEVTIEFDADAAAWVREREWHRSQRITERPDGSILLELSVCIDPPLRAWILGFGASARVVSPVGLAAEMLDAATRMRARYTRPAPVLRMESRQLTSERRGA